ncbi:DUF262 domain-containing protein [Reyranella sp.]|uniref:DUF262 domain-containing protein n=1 Tax=Reyranella sp. TaxID=1929291 RepID=UPI0037841A0B
MATKTTPADEEGVPEDQPPEIEDEYRLALDVDVEDESLLEQPGDAKFTITSYGVDYTVDTLVSRMNSEAFFVPQFQRRFVWSQRHASRFIESLLMGLPIPGIFLYKEVETGRHMVVDGQQRLRTLQFFHSGLFGERAFRLVGVRQQWANLTYGELSAADRLKLSDSVVHTTVFQQDEPKDTLKSLYFVFERINTGGIRLSPQEIRNCINDGPFLDTIRLLNEDRNWRAVFGSRRNARLKDHELILRFLALRERHEKYKAPMRDFLNTFTAEYSNADAGKLMALKKTFADAIKACFEAKGATVFRPIRALNAAVYEGVMLGVAERLADHSKPPPTTASLAAAYDTLLKDKNFLRYCERATAVEDSVKNRRSLAVKAFRGA